jgi:hypothetical protein
MIFSENRIPLFRIMLYLHGLRIGIPDLPLCGNPE